MTASRGRIVVNFDSQFSTLVCTEAWLQEITNLHVTEHVTEGVKLLSRVSHTNHIEEGTTH